MTWIYFCLIDRKQIKIGKAGNLKNRLSQHRKTTLSRHEVEMLAAVLGTGADEKHVQRYFESNAVDEMRPASNGTAELFWPSEELTNYIRWLRNQWFVTVDENELVSERLTFEMWEPNSERQCPAPSTDLFGADILEFPPRVVTADDYYTSPVILECARTTLGAIDLDPASHAMANAYVKAAKIYTATDNGLSHKWKGNVWLNPPFSQWKLWVPKIVKEWSSSHVSAMCVYSAMRTVTANYFRPILDTANAMCIITGRLRNGGRGTPSPDDGHCIFYFGSNAELFKQSFIEIGTTWIKL